jgi:hypothetical protein
MEPEEIENLRKKEEHLTEWLNRYGKAKIIVPDVQKNLEVTRWEIEALENRPTVAGEVPSASDLRYYTAEDYKNTVSGLPMMPDYNPMVMGTATSVTASGTTVVYNHIARYADFHDAKAVDFSNEQTRRYREIQERQERPKQVRSLMQIFCGINTLDRFDMSVQAYLSSKSGAIAGSDAANAIRNVIWGLKGDLFEKAKATPRENMTWEIMSQRLAKGVKEGELLAQNESIQNSLISGLSDILKDRTPNSATNLDNLWARTLDFIYAVLNLLKPISKEK